MNTHDKNSRSATKVAGYNEVYMYGSGQRVKFIRDHDDYSILCVPNGMCWEGDYDGPPIPAMYRIHPSNHTHPTPPAPIIGAEMETVQPATTGPIMIMVAPASSLVPSNAQTKAAKPVMQQLPAKPVRTYLERQFREMQTGLGVTLIGWFALVCLTVIGGPATIWVFGLYHAFCMLAVIIWAGMMVENRHKRTKATQRAANRSLMPSPPPAFPKGTV